MLFRRIVIYLLFILFAFEAQAASKCDLAEKLSHPNVISNKAFWDDYSRLSIHGEIKDADVERLLKRYGVEASKVVDAAEKTTTASTNAFKYETTKKADKDIATLSPTLRAHYEEFMSILTKEGGLQKLYENPGKWGLKKLKGLDNQYSVRLNKGFRVLFNKTKDGVEVLEANRSGIYDH